MKVEMNNRSEIAEAIDVTSAVSFFAQKQHFLIHVYGTVQGVGFRPFVHRLAASLNLRGTVLNDASGVTIHVEGEDGSLRQFIHVLAEDAPPAARIVEIRTEILPLSGFASFDIIRSEHGADVVTEVSPDLALCQDCEQELLDPTDRRHRYPFINCTNCGPRFTIIRGLPYDRPLTTMAGFELCPSCRAEYENPADRRFHAQPVACPTCGPRLSLLTNVKGEWQHTEAANVIRKAAERLRRGRILLMQGIGGFHLAVDAQHAEAVRELRRRKRREQKPLAVMFPTLALLEEWCEVSSAERELLTSPRAPIVLLRKRPSCPVADAVAPGNPQLGCLLPYSPLHVLLLNAVARPLVMTSANPCDEPMVYRVEDALSQMSGIADVALLHNREIHTFADDSVVKVVNHVPRVWRRARGYVPEPIQVPVEFERAVLAFGADIKNTFCIARGSGAVLSQHLGDLETERGAEAQQRVLAHFLSLYGTKIEHVACDLHPDYVTTRLAEEWSVQHNLKLTHVQHHHAHMASCMAANGVTEQVIGLCLDGTGYGTDSTIWGGELLTGDFRSFERRAHVESVPMIGGELAARQPWRMALAWLHHSVGEKLFELPLAFVDELKRRYSKQDLLNLVRPSLMNGVYPKTSSAGRLFDAVSALLGFGMRDQYEGQAAMELEWKLGDEGGEGYPFDIRHEHGCDMLSPVPMFEALIKDLCEGISEPTIAYRFHEGFARALCDLCVRVGNEHSLTTVALSGGCFQNAFLLSRCEELLTGSHFRVLTHRDVPTNDGGIALGQACIANAQEN